LEYYGHYSNIIYHFIPKVNGNYLTISDKAEFLRASVCYTNHLLKNQAKIRIYDFYKDFLFAFLTAIRVKAQTNSKIKGTPLKRPPKG